MVRIRAEGSGSSIRPVRDAAIGQIVRSQPTDCEKTRPWPWRIIAAIYRHLLEGIHILGEANSTYDNRNIQ